MKTNKFIHYARTFRIVDKRLYILCSCGEIYWKEEKIVEHIKEKNEIK